MGWHEGTEDRVAELRDLEEDLGERVEVARATCTRRLGRFQTRRSARLLYLAVDGERYWSCFPVAGRSGQVRARDGRLPSVLTTQTTCTNISGDALGSASSHFLFSLLFSCPTAANLLCLCACLHSPLHSRAFAGRHLGSPELLKDNVAGFAQGWNVFQAAYGSPILLRPTPGLEPFVS